MIKMTTTTSCKDLMSGLEARCELSQMRMSLLNEVGAKVAQFSLTGLEAVDRLVETTTPPEEA
jgi:chemotaxis protein CheY-P-specific phosphatase CheC